MIDVKLDNELLEKLYRIYKENNFDAMYEDFNEFLNISLNQSVSFLKDWKLSQYDFAVACLVDEQLLKDTQELSETTNKPLHQLKSEIYKLGYETMINNLDISDQYNFKDEKLFFDEGYEVSKDGEWFSKKEIREKLEKML